VTVPLGYWESLTNAVCSTIAKDRVGTPVFVRWSLLVADDRKDFERLVATMLLTVGEWFGSEVIRIMVLAPDDPYALAVSAEFPGGETALLTAGLSHRRPALDFILLGNEGAAYQHEFTPDGQDRSFAAPESAAIDTLVAGLRNSLRSGIPTEVGV
jgi:hypothetical protein